MKTGSLMAVLTGIQEDIGKRRHKEDITDLRGIGNVPGTARFGCRANGKAVAEEGIK
jgi:hypothetical protein